jgi:hypothetical protein
MGRYQQCFVMGVALWITACSSKGLPVGRDGAVEVKPASDATVDRPPLVHMPDAISAISDLGTPMPDVVPRAGDPDTAIEVARPVEAPIDSARPAFETGEVAADPYANRTFTIRPQNPAPTPDPTCTQYGPTDYFQLTFSADNSTIKVLMVSGSAATPLNATMGPEANKLTYHLTDSFGGGKITIERDQGVAVAQVIVYGSGVPVIRCLRGALTPQP